MATGSVKLGDAHWDIGGNTKPLKNDVQESEQIVTRSTQNMKRDALIVAGAMTAMGAGILAGLGKAAQASISFEAAFTGVRKTVDATEAEFAQMRRGLIELSRIIPVSVTQLARIAEIAGQIGISKENIVSFTRTIADLEVTTDIAGESGALLLARFLKLNDIPQDAVRNIASGIVFLGQSAAATESEILTMAQRLSAAGRIAGLTVGEILGLATSLASVGVQAQLGGTNMSKIIRKMDNDFRKGGDSMKVWADVAGVSAAEFRRVYGEEGAAKALTMMLVGLSEVQQAGGDYAQLIDNMGLKGERLIDVIGRTSLTVGSLEQAMKDGNRETQSAVAINKEAALFYGTAEAKLTLLRTAIEGVARAIGDSFNIELKENSDIMSQYLNKLEDVITAHPTATKNISATAAAFGVLGLAMLPLAGTVIVLTSLKGLIVGIGVVFGVTGSIIVGAVAGILGAIALFAAEMVLIVRFIETEWGSIPAFFSSIWDDVITNAAGAMSFLQDLLLGPLGTVFLEWAGLLPFFNSLLSSILSLTQDFARFMINSLLAPLNLVTELLNKLGILGFFGIATPTIPTFASGGPIRSPLAIVGEQGPELVVGAQGSQVFNASDTKDILSGASSNSVTIGDVNVFVNTGDGAVDGREVGMTIFETLQERLVAAGVPPLTEAV